ncbi:MAG: site-specific integrase [Anaerolineales bacterium]|nr:site-specific integrase [Anaerolineales bacterium]
MDNTVDDLPLFSYGREQGPKHPAGDARLNSETSLSAVIKSWGEALEDQGYSIHTVKAFTGDLRLVAKFVGGGVSIQEISNHDLKNFLDWMQNKRSAPCSPKTYARRVTSIKAFYRWLNESGVLSDDPSAHIPQQSVVSPLPDVLARREREIALEAAQRMREAEEPDARPYTLLRLLLETGIKKGECLGVHLNHIDLEGPDAPLLFVRYGDVSKRYKERKIPLSEEWVAAFLEYIAQYDIDDQLFPWSPRRLEYLLEEISDAAKLDKRISFDMCRWSASLADHQEGLDKDTIRQKLGISKIQWREVGNKLKKLSAQQG